MLLPPALGFSPHLPVSVYGTGVCIAIAAFLGTCSLHFVTDVSLRVTAPDPACLLTHASVSACTGLSVPGLQYAHASPQVLNTYGTGISTCCPSATPFGLTLGPDLPRADQLHPGNLGYSAARILTLLSLLIPAFSLPVSPRLLIGTASSLRQCSSTTVLTYDPELR